MKKIIIVFALVIMPLFMTAQSSNLIILTDKPNVEFRVYLNGDKQNNFFQKKIEIEDLEAKTYMVRLSFKGENLADITREVELDANHEKSFAIKQKGALKQKFQKIGRNIGNSMNDKEDSDLIAPYELKKISNVELN